MIQNKTLGRSRTDSIIGGVSGGLGKYFNTDPVVFRILFVVLTFLAAGGVLAYIIFWIVMPLEPVNFSYEEPYFKDKSAGAGETSHDEKQASGNPYSVKNFKPKNDGSLIVGIVLITLGGMFLVSRLIPHINFRDIWPVIIIVIGIVIIAGNLRPKKEH